jgi:hypothetical protein
MALSQRQPWPESSHEQTVEKFYGWGVENYGDFQRLEDALRAFGIKPSIEH